MSRIAFLICSKCLWFLILVIVLLHLLGEHPVLGAETVSSPDGQWAGKIDTPGDGLEITIDLWSAGEGLAGVISIPAQGLSRFPLSDLSSTDGETGFDMSGIPGHPKFRGTLVDGVFEGKFTQGGASFPFKLQRTGDAEKEEEAEPVDAGTAKPYLGSWNGTLSIPGSSLRLVFHLKLDDANRLTGTIDSIDQGANDMPISRGSIEGGKLLLEMPQLGASYEATLSEDGSKLAGAWRQGVREMPLELARSE